MSAAQEVALEVSEVEDGVVITTESLQHPEVCEYEPTNVRRERHSALGFPSVIVPPGMSATVSVTTAVPLYVDRLIIPDEIARSFKLDQILVGHLSATDVPVPATLFTVMNLGVRFACTLLVGERMSLTVRNIDTEDKVFKAGMMGTVL
jgi:hypothetical protein